MRGLARIRGTCYIRWGTDAHVKGDISGDRIKFSALVTPLSALSEVAEFVFTWR